MEEKNYVVMLSPKSTGVAILLAFLLGPIGMFYSTISGAFIMLFVTILAFICPPLLIITQIICIIWSYNAVNEYNNNLYINTK